MCILPGIAEWVAEEARSSPGLVGVSVDPCLDVGVDGAVGMDQAITRQVMTDDQEWLVRVEIKSSTQPLHKLLVPGFGVDESPNLEAHLDSTALLVLDSTAPHSPHRATEDVHRKGIVHEQLGVQVVDIGQEIAGCADSVVGLGDGVAVKFVGPGNDKDALELLAHGLEKVRIGRFERVADVARQSQVRCMGDDVEDDLLDLLACPQFQMQIRDVLDGEEG